MTSRAESLCPGTLNRKVSFFNPRPFGGSDGYGGGTGASGPSLLDVRAQIKTEQKGEVFDDEQVKGETGYIIMTYWCDDVAALGDLTKLRLRFGTREFRIASFNNLDEQDRKLEMKCVEVGSDG